jgi:type IV pilus assembly protein PilO
VQVNNRLILILGILLIVLLGVGYYFLLLGPKLAELEAADQERSDKETQLADLQQQVNELEEVRANAPEVERQLLELSKRIPSQPEIPTLVVQIREIALASGVTQLLVQPGAPETPSEGGDFSRIPITMTFEGTYEELQNFLLRARQLARLVTINSVTYEPVDPEAGSTEADAGVERLLQVEIESEVYFQPSDDASVSTPAPAAPLEVTTPEEETTAADGAEAP